MQIEHLGQVYNLAQPRTTSPSAQKNYQTCPGLDWWKAVAGVREPSTDAQLFGTAVSERCERYLKGSMAWEAATAAGEVIGGWDVGQMVRAILSRLPSPAAQRLRVEEWLGLQWTRPEGMPRIAQKPDVVVLTRLDGEDDPYGGVGGSGLYWVNPPARVHAVEDIKTANGYRWSLTGDQMGRDVQMAWYGLGILRQYGGDRIRLGQPQGNKRDYTARWEGGIFALEELERTFAESEALQREMNDVRAIRDPGELAAQGLLNWGQCANLYGRPCPNFDRCGAYRPVANADNRPAMTLAELSAVIGRQKKGETTMATDTLASKLFPSGGALEHAKALREKAEADPGGVNPPDGEPPDATPDEEWGIDSWEAKATAAGSPYWIAKGTRHGEAWVAYGQQVKGFSFYHPPYVHRDPSTHTPYATEADPDAGAWKVIEARAAIIRALKAWDAEVNPPEEDLPPEELPEDELPPSEEETPEEDIGASIAAAVGEADQSAPAPGPAFDVQAAQAALEGAGFPQWAAERIPGEMGLGLPELEALFNDDPAKLAGTLQARLRAVGPGKAGQVIDALQARADKAGPPASAAPRDDVEEVLEELEAADAPAEEPTPAPSPQRTLSGPDVDELETLYVEERKARQGLEKALETAKADILALKAALDKAQAAAPAPAEGYTLLIECHPAPGPQGGADYIRLEDLIRSHVTAACERLGYPSLELDPKAFGNPYKEVLRHLNADPPPTDRPIYISKYSSVWKGVEEWFMRRRAMAYYAG